MARGTWNIQVKSGGNWGAISTIIRPNQSFVTPVVSTQSKSKSVDGDNIYFTPATKYTNEPISWTWYLDDGTLKTQIEGYITAQSDLKVTDDLSNIYYGRFISIHPLRAVGTSDIEYDIDAVFEQIPSLE